MGIPCNFLWVLLKNDNFRPQKPSKMAISDPTHVQKRGADYV